MFTLYLYFWVAFMYFSYSCPSNVVGINLRFPASHFAYLSTHLAHIRPQKDPPTPLSQRTCLAAVSASCFTHVIHYILRLTRCLLGVKHCRLAWRQRICVELQRYLTHLRRPRLVKCRFYRPFNYTCCILCLTAVHCLRTSTDDVAANLPLRLTL